MGLSICKRQACAKPAPLRIGLQWDRGGNPYYCASCSGIRRQLRKGAGAVLRNVVDHLRNQRVVILRGRVRTKDKVRETVENHLALVNLNRLCRVRAVTVNHVRTHVDQRGRTLPLLLIDVQRDSLPCPNARWQ